METYYVGQGVGLVDKIQSVRNVVYGFKDDFVRSYARLGELLGE